MPAKKGQYRCILLEGGVFVGIFLLSLVGWQYVHAHESVAGAAFQPPPLTGMPTYTSTFTPTRTVTRPSLRTDAYQQKASLLCPVNTPEPLWVEPVTSPTDLFNQVIVVRVGNSDSVTVEAESGSFNLIGSFSTGAPAYVSIALLPNVTHHLTVSAHIRPWSWNECQYPGYTLTTHVDKNGNQLTLVQQGGEPFSHWLFLPWLAR